MENSCVQYYKTLQISIIGNRSQNAMQYTYITQSFKIPAKYYYNYTFNKILLIYALAECHLLTINKMEISPADYNAARC